MRSKDSAAKFARLLVPALAIAVAYGVLFAIPLQRERDRVFSTSQQHSAATKRFDLRLRSQHSDTRKQRQLLDQLADTRAPLSSTTHVASLVNHQPTCVQAFAKLLEILESHRVECTATNSDSAEQVVSLAANVTHHVSLTGGFGDVLASLKLIESRLPSITAAEFSMTRPNPTDECRWDILFRFESSK